MSETPQYDWQRDDYRRFEVGEVISRAFGLLRTRLIETIMLAVALIFGPGILVNATPYFFAGEPDGVTVLLVFVGILAFLAASVILTIALIIMFVRQLWGEHVEAGDAVRAGLPRFWPYFWTGVLSALGFIAGFILLIVPAIILACGWYVMGPVVVGERLSGSDALKRSWELTNGSKWQIFAIFIIVLVIAMIAGGLMGGIGGAFLGIDAVNKAPEASLISVLAFSAIESAAGAIGSVLSVAFIASVYYELLYLKGELNAD